MNNRAGQEGFHTDARRVARQFDRAAAGYEREAVMQQTVAARLIERLQYMNLSPALILELGSGTGRSARALCDRFRSALILELDLAPEMLRQARPGWWRRRFTRRLWMCADAQRIPLGAAGIDLIFSSLMLQWCNEPDAVFAEAARVLRPGGLLLFATLGPDTLRELRESWGNADDAAHVNAFADMHDLGDALMRAGLRDPVMEVEQFTLTYADVFALMRDLKQLGAQNANAGRRRTLTGKERMGRMLQAYERHRRDGLLPANYEVVYGHAWGGGHARRLDPHTVAFPVSALRRHGGARNGSNSPA
ncbi:MAG: malonyl-ACP O-methyltransferase BioC [Gammaproteobacteria bacterium]|nr:malonyl-ACP O-methyltransferase BioC [Gammaproteobacteria bacterium]